MIQNFCTVIVTASEHRLKARNAHIGAARVAFFPRKAQSGSLRISSAELPELFEGDSGAWHLCQVCLYRCSTAGATTPIWIWPRYAKKVSVRATPSCNSNFDPLKPLIHLLAVKCCWIKNISMPFNHRVMLWMIGVGHRF